MRAKAGKGAAAAAGATGSDQEQALIAAAWAARAHAYAPYSGFAVGAAILGASGMVHAGCNVENAAYPGGLCAEAAAVAALIAAGERVIRAVVVATDSAQPVPPCGGCRQKLAEFAAPEVPVLMVTKAGLRAEMTLGDLLPGAFGPGHLPPGRT